MPEGKHFYEFGPFRLDPAERSLLRDGKAVPLTPKAFELLVLLVENRGHLLKKEELIERVWPNTFVEEANLAQNVSALRKALEDKNGGAQYIETVPKGGYRFTTAVADKTLATGVESPAAEPLSSRPASKVSLPYVLTFLASAAVAVTIMVASQRGLLHRHWSGAASVPRIQSLAVMPFGNASNNSEMDYLGEGLSEEITNSLSRLPNLRVMAHSTVSRYKSGQNDPQRAGRDLHVDAVLTGSVAEHGNELNVETELVDVATGAQLWGERYTRSANDASLLQAVITRDIASKLRPQLSGNERESLAKVGTKDAEAYQLYLKGRYHANKLTGDGLKKGIEYFRQAIEKDPGDALAYAGLADCYIDLGAIMAYLPQSEVFPRAKAAATKALEIDDTLAEAHAAFASVKGLYEWDWTGAEREFKRAIALNPNSADAHNRYGGYLMSMGRFDEGLTETIRAQDLDPLSPTVAGSLGYNYMVAHRYDDSIDQCKKAIELDPNAMWLHAILAWAYARKGMHSQAITEYEKMGPARYAVSAENQLIASGLGWVYAIAGRRKDAVRIIEDFNTLSSGAHVDPYWVAAIYAGLRDKDRAFELLEKSYREHGVMAFLTEDPFWEDLRSDPRYADLLRRIGLPH
jgi:DNA-binding winged helix-turn-helix (wHTH) protein/TolB-like protein/Tfp pilus assembly protein PilF